MSFNIPKIGLFPQKKTAAPLLQQFGEKKQVSAQQAATHTKPTFETADLSTDFDEDKD